MQICCAIHRKAHPARRRRSLRLFRNAGHSRAARQEYMYVLTSRPLISHHALVAPRLRIVSTRHGSHRADRDACGSRRPDTPPSATIVVHVPLLSERSYTAQDLLSISSLYRAPYSNLSRAAGLATSGEFLFQELWLLMILVVCVS